MKRRVHLQVVAIAFVATVVFSLIGVQSQNTPQATVAIDPDDIGGVVTSSRGPEAGVWVIAETRDTPTRLIKSVVTDDRGRYLIPDLPKGNYDVWVRVRSIIRRSIGMRCWNCLGQTSFQEPGRTLMELPQPCEARANGSATSSARTAAPVAIKWATERPAKFPRRWAHSRIRLRLGSGEFSPGRPAME